jgi:hypothetical protein
MPLSIQSAAQLQQKMTTGTNFQDHGLLMVSIAGKIRSSAGSLVPKPVTIDYDKHIMQALLHRIYMVGTWYHNIFGVSVHQVFLVSLPLIQVALSI